MNLQDIATIEQRLAVRLPQPYRNALLQGVCIGGYDPGPHFNLGPTEILISNLELRMTARPVFADGLWPQDQICIGADGCGNFYSVSSGDDQCGVRFFDHEANQFETIYANLDDYFAHLATLFKQIAARFKEQKLSERSAPPVVESRTAELARAETPRQSVLNPISLEEWTRFVESAADLEMRGYMVRANPFTEAEMRIDRPGLAIMRVGNEVYEFLFYYGRITVDNPGPTVVVKLKQAAAALNCNLLWS